MFRSVLVVDDDVSFRRIIGRVLSGWGHVVIGEAGGVDEALMRANELRPDTVLVDVGLPDGDGLSLARQLCAMPWPLRVVLVSTDADGTSTLAAHRAGAIAFVPKTELSGRAFRQLMEGE